MKLIFIGGAQRSGTTLMQTLLSNALNHTEVWPEANFLCDLFQFYTNGIKNWNKSEFYFGKRDYFKSYVKELINNILKYRIPKDFKGNCIIIKDPNFSKYIKQIYEIFPESSFFLCVRDPRDIICSFYDIENREAQNGTLRNNYKNRNISFYCKKINESYKLALKYTKKINVIKYEKLVDNPFYEINSISSKEMPFSLSSTENLIWSDKKMRHKNSWISPLEEKSPSKERVGVYKSILRGYEIFYCQKKCNNIFKSYGYKKVLFSARKKFFYSILSKILYK
ncbi:hypothetical protein DSCW_09590 [Desulfosarcina widdelii]|uniref:Sulfotransferase n=1 Tax=Desulfosarcina widdelii TaxID=947919 RepID=A0A5K7YUT1_9BACT|nr:sulfotransferase [Desulfosarcina widdelii]BBO73542.1 hypothetical protein DSCW_09590 [Desulfosarcina widdelii]